MTIVTYTNKFAPARSEAVDCVFFDSRTGELTVVLTSGGTYRYTGADQAVYDNFGNAASSGRYYVQVVKRGLGPGEYLGDEADVDFQVVDHHRSPVGAVPKNLVDRQNSSTAGPQVTHLTLHSSDTGSAVRRKHVVHFEANGAMRAHTLDAESVDEAVSVIEQIGDMLDLEFKVKEVCVYFE